MPHMEWPAKFSRDQIGHTCREMRVLRVDHLHLKRALKIQFMTRGSQCFLGRPYPKISVDRDDPNRRSNTANVFSPLAACDDKYHDVLAERSVFLDCTVRRTSFMQHVAVSGYEERIHGYII